MVSCDPVLADWLALMTDDEPDVRDVERVVEEQLTEGFIDGVIEQTVTGTVVDDMPLHNTVNRLSLAQQSML